MKTLLFPLLALVGLTLSAPAQNGGVAVLDIDEVARQLGIEEKVRVDPTSRSARSSRRTSSSTRSSTGSKHRPRTPSPRRGPG
jgi:hypothetical protein